jgi:hypothetical protein
VRTFQQFDPFVSAVIVFRSRSSSDAALDASLRKDLPVPEGARVEISTRDGWRLLEITSEMAVGPGRMSQISPDLYRSKLDEMNIAIGKAKDIIAPHVPKGVRTSSTILFGCGTRDSAWLKNYSDISFLYKEKGGSLESEGARGEIYQTNIAYLNRILGYRGKILVNSLKHNGITGLLYLLDRKSDETSSDQCILIEIDVDQLRTAEAYSDPMITVKTKSPYSRGDEGEKEPHMRKENYLATISGIRTKLIDLIILDSALADMMENDILALKGKGNDLLDAISKIQNNINEHMKGYAPASKGSPKKSDKETYDREKGLLTDASIHFSMVSEVENDIIRMFGRMRDMEDRIKDRTISLSLSYDPHSTDEDRTTFSDAAIRRISQDTVSLREMSEKLTHSRSILTSTIEVLRTFLETRQREVSERMSRQINMLFLVFACFGLADALGNFVIVILEHGFLGTSPSLGRVFEVTTMGLMLTLIPLFVSAGLLYMYFQRRR